MKIIEHTIDILAPPEAVWDVLVDAVPRVEVAWLGRFLAPGIVDGTHTFTLEPLPGGGTCFRQREIFRGVLVPFLSPMLRDTAAGFAAMNAALAERAVMRLATDQF